MKTMMITFSLFLSAALIAVVGCSSPAEPPVSTEKTSQGDHDYADHNHADHGDKTDMEMMKESLAKLSPEDAASAEKQHVCPVTGEMLGTMGLPIKVTLDDQDVWVCCDHCVDKVKADPEKYLAKLKK